MRNNIHEREAMTAPFAALAGKRVLVTGNTGFKGSWLSLWLARLGAEVHGYALAAPTQPSNFEVSRIQECLTSQCFADVRQLGELKAAMERVQPDLVMHLAAQSVVRESYHSPRETFETNVMGTVNVLEAVREMAQPVAVLCVTSDKCYENTERTWGYRECDAMGEHDPYGGSKGAAELAIRSYRHSFFPVAKLDQHGVRLASARAGNVIGGGDWTRDALIVDIFRSLSEGMPVAIRSPNAYRPWQHVLQCLSGYLTLAERLLTADQPEQFCSGWNIGPTPGNEIPVRQIVDVFLKDWGSGEWVDHSDPNQPPEANVLRLAIDKAIWKLDWRPAWTTWEAIEKTADWYREYLSTGRDMQQFSLDQIAEYESAMQSASESRHPANEKSTSQVGIVAK